MKPREGDQVLFDAIQKWLDERGEVQLPELPPLPEPPPDLPLLPELPELPPLPEE
jgi:hypothetical protein